MNTTYKDLTGQRFGRLIAKERTGSNERGFALWRCECDCGGVKIVSSCNLIHSQTRSCGCISRERTIKANESRKTHGMANTLLYAKWNGMKRRCYEKQHPKYKYYGGRGVKICDEWLDFCKFSKWALLNGYKDSLTIERIDVNGNYCPENCTWIPLGEQSKNRRITLKMEYDGITHTLGEWALITGVSYMTIYYRFQHGYPPEEVLSTRPLIERMITSKE